MYNKYGVCICVGIRLCRMGRYSYYLLGEGFDNKEGGVEKRSTRWILTDQEKLKKKRVEEMLKKFIVLSIFIAFYSTLSGVQSANDLCPYPAGYEIANLTKFDLTTFKIFYISFKNSNIIKARKMGFQP